MKHNAFLAKQINRNLLYRSDIDGLRAIAVIIVMLYHFSLGPFSGGFIGVDIFFVISGYLITGGVIKQCDNKSFSFSDFYIRRARRLFPALLCIVIFSYLSAFFFFSPIDFSKMSGSTVFALTGASNIFFWLEADYFDSASILKPLLHTWSLSVEFQFYLIWPIIVLLLSRFGKKIALIGMIAITAIGIVTAVCILNYDATGAFYLTQYRFHEFAIGGIVSFFGNSNAIKRKTYISDGIFIVGLVFIFFPALTYTTSTPFPGKNALIPVIGAALIILCGDKSRVSCLLSLRPMNYIGKISYSLYLTHWPLYVFTQYFLVRELSFYERLCLVFTTFVLAVLLYKLIETPFRDTKKFALTGTTFLLICAGIVIITVLPASSSWVNRGWVWRLPEQVRNINNFNIKEYQNYVWDRQVTIASRDDFEFNGKQKLLVIGDSQSADIINIMSESGEIENYDVVARTISYECGIPYLYDKYRRKYFTYENPVTTKSVQLIPVCEEQMDNAANKDLLKNADIIFVAMKWEYHSIGHLQEAIDFYRKNTDARVIVFGNKILSKSSIDIVNKMGRTTGVGEYAAQLRSSSSDHINKVISGMNGFKFVNLMELTCPEEQSCNVLTKDLKPIFFDPAHLTKYGAIYLGHDFSRLLEKTKNN